MNVRQLIVLASCFSLLALTGCNGNITGSAGGTNKELDAVHIDGPDCAQNGCHSGFGAAGTVFTDASGSSPAEGTTVKAKSVATGTEMTLGVTDTLGNFHYNQELSGYYNMAVGNGAWSNPHTLPEWSGCNSCHTWPAANGASGRLN